MPSHYPTRRAQNCPDGFEHQMPNGTWMCGRTHNNAPMFGDDLGFDDFNPDRNGRNLRQQQGNQTRGFGDDLGLFFPPPIVL